ncbi:YceI family protein [Sphingomonas quercus]|uniref:YceI family protein n=1 Tax=Sphingomonas quercus TaxID=2842451 RepID=A0ABS6BK24_9SPHN|nr:YceI family protein [Sphingomonas quercus]MBU3077796.1 YceI family protein [Sphingomonas quercus]
MTLRAALLLALAPAMAALPAVAIAQVSQDPAAAPAGTYNVDGRHASVIARIGHGGGSSLSTFRFGTVSGSLDWNPAQPQASKVNVTVDVKSIQTPIAGFADELIGDTFLNVAKYPTATFTSTSIQRTGPTTGKITGNFTFMGVTKPIVVDARMVGAGKGARNASVVGFSGTTKFKRSEFGYTSRLGPIGDEVELLLDIEFNKPAPAAG